MAAPTISATSSSAGSLPASDGADGAAIRNHLLRLLPESELDTILGQAEDIAVKSKEVLFERGESIAHVYFPENCVISLVTELENGDAVEAMTVGSDGFAGIAVFHGVDASRLKAVGQISGQAWRLRSKDFQELAISCAKFNKVLHRYSHLIFETVSQSAACNRLHVIEQRCARWLLMSQDRVGRDEFNLTQEFLAEMLGVRRPGVTVAMGALEKAGLIGHSRGVITVVDRPGLERAACECYATVKARQRELIS